MRRRASAGMKDAHERGLRGAERQLEGPQGADGRLTLSSSVPAQARPSSQTWTPQMPPAPLAPPPPPSPMTPGKLPGTWTQIPHHTILYPTTTPLPPAPASHFCHVWLILCV